MRGRRPTPLNIDDAQLAQLSQVANEPYWPRRTRTRAAVVARLALGERPTTLAAQLHISTRSVRRWRRLWQAEGMFGLIRWRRSTGRPRKPRAVPVGGSGRWS